MRQERLIEAEGLQRSLQRLLESAAAVDVARYESCDRVAIEGGLVSVLQRLLSVAASELFAVREHYDHDGAAGTNGGGVSDVVVLALWQMKQKQQDLCASQEDSWAMLAACARAHRVLFKSVTAVERAICDHEGLPTALDGLTATTLHRSLRIRRAYSVLRKEMENELPPNQEDLLTGLRRAVESLARLQRSRIYGDLRITDRVEFARIRGRIEAWLDRQDRHDPVSARRLWEDVASFSSVLREINNREVLREHDAAVVRSAYEALFDEPPEEGPAADAILIRLRSLWGRDDELDRLIRTAAELDPLPWRATLKRLSETLCSRQPATNGSERAKGEPASRRKESTTSGRFSRSITIGKIDEACKGLVGAVGGALACAVIDLHTELPLGIYNAVENTQARNECFAAAAAELFGGARPRRFLWETRNHPRDEREEPHYEEVYLASKSTCQFARVIRSGDALIVLVTRRGASIGMASGLLRAAVPSVEPLIP